MSDPAAVHAIAVGEQFDDLLEWDYERDNLTAWVAVHGLEGPYLSRLKIETIDQVDALGDCLAECEGCGLLWREDACLLYAARRLGVKPQPWAYSESEHINRLFDAIGAE